MFGILFPPAWGVTDTNIKTQTDIVTSRLNRPRSQFSEKLVTCIGQLQMRDENKSLGSQSINETNLVWAYF